MIAMTMPLIQLTVCQRVIILTIHKTFECDTTGVRLLRLKKGAPNPHPEHRSTHGPMHQI